MAESRGSAEYLRQHLAARERAQLRRPAPGTAGLQQRLSCRSRATPPAITPRSIPAPRPPSPISTRLRNWRRRTTTNTLSTLGTIRTNEQAFATKLSNLDSDTFSTDPSQQTQNALLGKINSATLLQIHSQQDTNQLLAASIQQQLIAQKQQIDAQNRAINNAIYFQQNFSNTMQNVNNGVSDSLHSISLSINGSN